MSNGTRHQPERAGLSAGRFGLRRGFTLVEVTAIIVIIALFAAMVAPNLASMKASRDHRAFFEKTSQIFAVARAKAIELKKPIEVHLDDAKNELFLAQVDADGNTTEVGARVALPSEMRVDELRQGTQTVSSGEWKPVFYPDGSSERSGIQVSEGDRTTSFVVSKLGFMQQLDGTLPDASLEKWTAGDYVRRQ